MFKYAIAALPFVTLAAPFAHAENSCEYGAHTFDIKTDAYYSDVCDTSINVIKWFEDQGYGDVNVNVNIEIAEAVIVPFFNDQGEVTAEAQVFGLYNAADDLVVMTRWGSEYLNGRTAWLTDSADMSSGIPIDYDLWLSVVAHEVAHQALQQIWTALNPTLAANISVLDSGLHEFVAYSVQLSLMDEQARDAAIAQYPGATAFPVINRLNGILHAYHPHYFGVRSYLSMNENKQWFNDIMSGKYSSFLTQM